MDTLFHSRHLLSRCDDHTYLPFLERLKRIYAAMDQKYKEAAEYYNFHCTGCEDNCCFTRFYHHTLLEYLYIYEGFKTFDRKKQKKIIQKASDVSCKSVLAAEKVQTVRLICPLNLDGLCLLYAFRPMICRLHGIPHELQQPGMEIVYGPGCEAFSKPCLQKNYFKFDRTPFYIEMAELEKELKQAVGMTQKLKFTVAEMINSF
jgi:Fe-S-cluster containining protein